MNVLGDDNSLWFDLFTNKNTHFAMQEKNNASMRILIKINVS